jgi:hypothetical protein
MAEEKTLALDENQRRVAQKILDMAPKYQVNPDFALAVAMAENMFRDETSHKGAIGPMQLMPDTAKSLRVDPYDEDQNIEGGLRLIRQLTGHDKVGVDPIRVLAGYHSGPNSTFFKTNNPDDLGPNALTYIDRVATFSGGQLPPVLLTEEAANAPQDAEPTEGNGTVEVSEEDMARQSADKRMQAMQALGAGAGAVASTVMDTTGRVGNMVVDKAAQKAANLMAGRAPAGALPTPPGAAPGAPPGAPTPQPSAQSTRIMQGGQGDPLGTTGRARQEGYNTETARRAAVANEMKATNPQARQILANAPGMTSTPSGVLYPTTEMRPTAGPRGQRAPTMAPDIGGVRPGGPSMGPSSFTPQPMAPAGALPTQKPSLARQAINVGRKAMDIPVIGPAATGALGGFGAVTEASDAAERYKRGDMLGAGISGIGALGSAAAVIPHPMTRVVGGGLAMAAPMANMIVDYMRGSSPLSQAQKPTR